MNKLEKHNKAGFKIPDNYLEQLKIQHNAGSDSQHGGFKMPEDYKISIPNSDETKFRVITLKKLAPYLVTAVAAAIAVLLILNSFTQKPVSELAMTDLADEDIILYLESNLDYNSDDLINTVIEDEDILSTITLEESLDLQELELLTQDYTLNQIYTE